MGNTPRMLNGWSLLTARSSKLQKALRKETASMFTAFATFATLLAIVGDILTILMFVDSVRSKKKWGHLWTRQAPPKSHARRESYGIPFPFLSLVYHGFTGIASSFSCVEGFFLSICVSRKKYRKNLNNFWFCVYLRSVSAILERKKTPPKDCVKISRRNSTEAVYYSG